MAAHAMLRRADLEDAQDAYFWIDPFSPEGQQVAAKLLPVAPEIRLDAEHAITLLAQARAAAKADGRVLANEEALDALELGARRIDFIGYKFQAAADCVKLYSRPEAMAGDKARWDEVSDLLETVASNNGRMQTASAYRLASQSRNFCQIVSKPAMKCFNTSSLALSGVNLCWLMTAAALFSR